MKKYLLAVLTAFALAASVAASPPTASASVIFNDPRIDQIASDAAGVLLGVECYNGARYLPELRAATKGRFAPASTFLTFSHAWATKFQRSPRSKIRSNSARSNGPCPSRSKIRNPARSHKSA